MNYSQLYFSLIFLKDSRCFNTSMVLPTALSRISTVDVMSHTRRSCRQLLGLSRQQFRSEIVNVFLNLFVVSQWAQELIHGFIFRHLQLLHQPERRRLRLRQRQKLRRLEQRRERRQQHLMRWGKYPHGMKSRFNNFFIFVLGNSTWSWSLSAGIQIVKNPGNRQSGQFAKWKKWSSSFKLFSINIIDFHPCLNHSFQESSHGQASLEVISGRCLCSKMS